MGTKFGPRNGNQISLNRAKFFVTQVPKNDAVPEKWKVGKFPALLQRSRRDTTEPINKRKQRSDFSPMPFSNLFLVPSLRTCYPATSVPIMKSSTMSTLRFWLSGSLAMGLSKACERDPGAGPGTGKQSSSGANANGADPPFYNTKKNAGWGPTAC